MPSSQITVFVSSKMEELAPERLAIKATLEELKVSGWVFESDAGARPQTIQQTYEEEIKKANLYIAVFWKGYGDYTIEEYKYARRQGKDCLIYEKRAEINGQRDERLQTFLDQIGKVETGLTVRWFNTPEELREFVKQDVAGWQAEIVRRYKVSGAPLTYHDPPPAEMNARKELLILLNKVKRFWIDGVLGHSVHHEALLQLGKKDSSEMVENPWETVLELPDRLTSSTLTDKRITDVFEDVGHFLLILGEPGSGKTTTMLELARDLIIQAEKDHNQAIPAIFNLSSWRDKGQSLNDWLLEELRTKYQVPKKTGQLWLEQHRLLLILDGLDEVRSVQQEFCVSAINEFVQEYPSGVVVCCRLKEYTDLPVRLKLNGAICLQPLSVDLANEYLTKAGSELAALREALKEDQNLQELVKTPLMLSIMSLAYQDQPVGSLSSTGFETIAVRRKHVFNVYIERMFERKGKQRQDGTKETVRRWLQWLAHKLRLHSQSIFLIEQLQPSWLSTRSQLIGYLLISRLAAGLMLGVSAGLPIGLGVYFKERDITIAVVALPLSSLGGLLLGLVTGFIDILALKINEKSKFIGGLAGFRYSLFNAGIYITLNLSLWLLFFLALLLLHDPGVTRNIPSNIMTILSMSLLVGIGHWFILGMRSNWQNASMDILTVERLSWTWLSAFRSGIWWATITLILVLPISFIIEKSENSFLRPYSAERVQVLSAELAIVEEKLNNDPVTSDEQGRNTLEERKVKLVAQIKYHKDVGKQLDDDRWATILLMPLGLSLLGGLTGFLIGGFTTTLTEGKASPNQGIRLSIRNAAVGGTTVGTISALVIGGLFVFLQRPNHISLSMLIWLLPALVVGLSTGVLFAFRYGGYDVIKHYVLRLILYRKGYTPKDYVSVLNYAASLVLLQKVGGGYIFIHRLLLEHFAAMDGTEGESQVLK